MKRLALTVMLMMSGAIFAPAFAQDAAEIILRLDRLEAENRRLNGQIEEMRFQIKRSEEQLKRFQTDADTRFRDIEAGRGGTRPAAASPTTPTTPGAPRPLTPNAQTSAAGDPSGPLDVTQPRRPAPVPNAGGDAKSDFEAAQALYANGEYDKSEGAFRDFARNHTKDRRVPDAIFFQGESLLARTRYREAAELYLTVTSKHSNATRAPEAMLKLGVALRGLGAKAEACGTFEQVPKKYPQASAAIRQAVEREKARASC